MFLPVCLCFSSSLCPLCSLLSLHSEGQRREEAVWFRLHSSDEGGWDHAVRREPWTLRLQGQTRSLAAESTCPDFISPADSWELPRATIHPVDCLLNLQRICEFTDIFTKNIIQNEWHIFFPTAIWKIITESESRDDIKPHHDTEICRRTAHRRIL